MKGSAGLSINPEILRWARAEAGFSKPDVAKKLGIEQIKYDEWEVGGAGIPFPALKEIARIYRRQIAVFFLPQVPKKMTQPTDHRNFDTTRNRLSVETLLAVRRAKRFRDVLIELNGNDFYDNKYLWLNGFENHLDHLTVNSSGAAVRLRNLVKYSIEDQVNDKDMSHAFTNWRSALERDLGIYVFQFSMPAAEIQGFCYGDTYPYCIAVNNKYAISSRIFTLFHELAHIIRKQSGICLPDGVTDNQSEEMECNSFAGEVLLPDKVMVRTVNKDTLYRYANRLKVSSEVYLRRLKSLELVSTEEFFYLLEEIRGSVKPYKGFGVSTPLQKSANTSGQSLFNSVLEALNRNRMSYERAADILQIKVNHLISA